MNTNEKETFRPVAIEESLPVKAVGIENLKESNPQHMPSHRYIHPWFARRPTPVSRLAVLGSLLPPDKTSDKILEYLQIGPNKELDVSISDYVQEKKRTESERNGTLGEHYGYPRPFTQSPSKAQIEELHTTLRKHWNGELPTVLDPTAGGGVIPYESVRYNLPTTANELNPVPTVLLKVILEFAPQVGSLERELRTWSEKIVDRADEKLSTYFPSVADSQTSLGYACTYKIRCDSCGGAIPLTPKWWMAKRANIAIYPEYGDDREILSYTAVNTEEDEIPSDFDPSDGPVSRSGAECPHCGVLMENGRTKELLRDGDYEYEPFGVKYSNRNGGNDYRGATDVDRTGMRRAQERVESDPDLHQYLATDLPNGEKTSEPISYGMTQWRDIFTPRQLVTLYEYQEAFNHYKSDIIENYGDDKSVAILTLLTLAASKVPNHNSRLTSWYTPAGHPDQVFRSNHFSPQKLFCENNVSADVIGYKNILERIIEEYENIVRQLEHVDSPAEVQNGDAADLDVEDDSVSAVVIDPPYYDNIMYAELADFFYVVQKGYLSDIFPDLFDQPLTEKQNEAVANPAKFDSVAGGGQSKRELAKQDYEDKMSDIFSEMYRVLEPGGVMTVMFTHKDADAWDTLTMSLIKSNFIVTSTHPVTSEVPHRVGMQDSASADSTILLTGRKPDKEHDPETTIPSLWSDVRSDTRSAAKEAARDLLDSGLSLTKTDVIISAFGPTLRVFADAYPVVDDEDNEVKPRRALEEAREAVTQVLVDEYLEGQDVDTLDDVTEWYILCWLVHESETFAYDDGRQLGLGIGVDIDEIKRSTKTWRKKRGDISLRGHDGRVQNINEKPEDRSSRLPVDPDDLSFPRSLDAVHAAMHVYDKRGETEAIEWLRERNFDSDGQFKATLKALLQVLPHNHEDWELARDLAVGRTSDVLDLDFSPSVFAKGGDDTTQSTLGEH